MFSIKGRPTKVSLEQVRSFLHASLCVLAYHNLTPVVLPIKVFFKKKFKNLGEYCEGCIWLRSELELEDMLTTCLHEVIHACVRFPDGTLEKCTSTLCSKLKPDVAELSKILLEGTYRRAGYIAHTKLSYPVKDGEDFYDESEDEPVGLKPKYYKKRR